MGDDPVRAAIDFFDQEATAFAERNPRPSEHLDQLLSALPPGARILEMGCGPGTDARALHDAGHKVVAVDAAPGMIAIARSRHPDIEFRLSDLRDIEPRAGSFEGILALYSLIFVPKAQLPSLLARLHHALVPRGVLLLSVQGGPPSDVGEAAIFSVMTREEIHDLLREAGFTVEMTFERAHHPHERPYRKVHLLARRP